MRPAVRKDTRIDSFQLIRLLHKNDRMRTRVHEARDASGLRIALKLVAREPDPDEQRYRMERLAAESN